MEREREREREGGRERERERERERAGEEGWAGEGGTCQGVAYLCGIEGLGAGRGVLVQVSGFLFRVRVSGSSFDLGLRVEGLGCRVQGSGLRFRDLGSGFRVQGSGLGFRVKDVGIGACLEVMACSYTEGLEIVSVCRSSLASFGHDGSETLNCETLNLEPGAFEHSTLNS